MGNNELEVKNGNETKWIEFLNEKIVLQSQSKCNSLDDQASDGPSGWRIRPTLWYSDVTLSDEFEFALILPQAFRPLFYFVLPLNWIEILRIKTTPSKLRGTKVQLENNVVLSHSNSDQFVRNLQIQNQNM